MFHLSGVLMILGGSLEFEKGHNREIQERPSDNIELPEVIPAFFPFFLLKLFISLCFSFSLGKNLQWLIQSSMHFLLAMIFFCMVHLTN